MCQPGTALIQSRAEVFGKYRGNVVGLFGHEGSQATQDGLDERIDVHDTDVRLRGHTADELRDGAHMRSTAQTARRRREGAGVGREVCEQLATLVFGDALGESTQDRANRGRSAVLRDAGASGCLEQMLELLGGCPVCAARPVEGRVVPRVNPMWR